MLLTQTIYIDVLFCVNFIIDYLILLSVKKFLSLPNKKARLVGGAVVGGLSSMIVLAPPFPFWLSIVYNVSTAALINAVAFLPLSKGMYLRASMSFFMIGFCYSGLMTAVLVWFSPKNLMVRNSTVYIGISPLLLIVLTVVCYFVMRFMLRITGRGVPKAINCRVSVQYDGKTVETNGKIDTCNTLREPFSGECVIVTKEKLFSDKQYNAVMRAENPKGIRLIPYSSVGGGGVIPAFKPDKIMIEYNQTQSEVDAYIALCRDENMTSGIDMLVPAELIVKGS